MARMPSFSVNIPTMWKFNQVSRIMSVLGGQAGFPFSSAAATHGHYGLAVAKDSQGNPRSAGQDWNAWAESNPLGCFGAQVLFFRLFFFLIISFFSIVGGFVIGALLTPGVMVSVASAVCNLSPVGRGLLCDTLLIGQLFVFKGIVIIIIFLLLIIFFVGMFRIPVSFLVNHKQTRRVFDSRGVHVLIWSHATVVNRNGEVNNEWRR